MSQENVEVVRRVYEAAARRDTEGVLALYDPDVEWDVTRSPMARLVGEGVYHGHEVAYGASSARITTHGRTSGTNPRS